MEEQNIAADAESLSEKKRSRPRAWLAALLALIMPGLGHLYLGLPISAVVIWVVALVLVNLLIAMFTFSGWGFLPMAVCLMVAVAFMVAQIAHAVWRVYRLKHRRLLVPWYGFVLILAAWFLFYRNLVPAYGDYHAYKIESTTMERTLFVGDNVMADLNAYEHGDVQRGDVIVFVYPGDNKTLYVKRCIGLPGDTIRIVDKTVFVNGQEEIAPLTIRHTDSEVQPRRAGGLSSRDNFGPYIVPTGSYFVLGDSRDNSSDSRYWGGVPRKNILGKAIRIYWSSDLSRVGKRVL